MYYRLHSTEVGNIQGNFNYICTDGVYIVIESDKELQAPFILIKERYEPADDPETIKFEVEGFIGREKEEIKPLLSTLPYDGGTIHIDITDQLNMRSCIDFGLDFQITIVRDDSREKVILSGEDLKKLYEAFTKRANKILNTFSTFQTRLRECKLLSQIEPIVREYRDGIAKFKVK